MRPDLQKAAGAARGAAERSEEVDVIVDAAFGGPDGERTPAACGFVNRLRRDGDRGRRLRRAGGWTRLWRGWG
jgi:hypothetical protein